MNWAPQEPEAEVEELGRILSEKIHCAVRRMPSHIVHPGFQCFHMVTFALYVIQGAKASGNWAHVIEHHNQRLGG